MNKIIFIILIGLSVIFLSCKPNSEPTYVYLTQPDQQTRISTDTNIDTAQVIITATGGSAKYSFINDEGEIYKQGMVYNSEKLTVKHFKKGTYHVQYQYGGYVGTYTVVSIVKNCIITFRNANSLTVE